MHANYGKTGCYTSCYHNEYCHAEEVVPSRSLIQCKTFCTQHKPPSTPTTTTTAANNGVCVCWTGDDSALGSNQQTSFNYLGKSPLPQECCSQSSRSPSHHKNTMTAIKNNFISFSYEGPLNWMTCTLHQPSHDAKAWTRQDSSRYTKMKEIYLEKCPKQYIDIKWFLKGISSKFCPVNPTPGSIYKLFFTL